MVTVVMVDFQNDTLDTLEELILRKMELLWRAGSIESIVS